MGIDLQGHLVLLVVLQHMDVLDSGHVHAQNHDIPPDAGIGQPGTPVPAEHAVGLADMGEAHHGVGRTVCDGLCILLFDIFGGGGKADGNGILA